MITSLSSYWAIILSNNGRYKCSSEPTIPKKYTWTEKYRRCMPTALLTGRYAPPGTRVARSVQVIRHVWRPVCLLLHASRWPHLTACTHTVTSRHYPYRLLFTNMTSGPSMTTKERCLTARGVFIRTDITYRTVINSIIETYGSSGVATTSRGTWGICPCPPYGTLICYW